MSRVEDDLFSISDELMCRRHIWMKDGKKAFWAVGVGKVICVRYPSCL